MTIEQWFGAIAALSALPVSIIEIVKPGLKRYNLSEDVRRVLYLVLTFLIGVGASASSLEPLAFFTDVPWLFHLTSGALLVVGDEVLDKALDIWRAFQRWIENKGAPTLPRTKGTSG